MGAEIGVDVLRSEFGCARPVDGPVGEIAHDSLVVRLPLRQMAPRRRRGLVQIRRRV